MNALGSLFGHIDRCCTDRPHCIVYGLVGVVLVIMLWGLVTGQLRAA